MQKNGNQATIPNMSGVGYAAPDIDLFVLTDRLEYDLELARMRLRAIDGFKKAAAPILKMAGLKENCFQLDPHTATEGILSLSLEDIMGATAAIDLFMCYYTDADCTDYYLCARLIPRQGEGISVRAHLARDRNGIIDSFNPTTEIWERAGE